MENINLFIYVFALTSTVPGCAAGRNPRTQGLAGSGQGWRLDPVSFRWFGFSPTGQRCPSRAVPARPTGGRGTLCSRPAAPVSAFLRLLPDLQPCSCWRRRWAAASCIPPCDLVLRLGCPANQPWFSMESSSMPQLLAPSFGICCPHPASPATTHGTFTSPSPSLQRGITPSVPKTTNPVAIPRDPNKSLFLHSPEAECSEGWDHLAAGWSLFSVLEK